MADEVKDAVTEAVEERQGFGEPKEVVEETETTEVVEEEVTTDESEEGDGGETSEALEEAVEGADGETETDEQKEIEAKQFAQKRIDSLIARMNKLETENAVLKGEVQKTDKNERVYSKEQLDTAEQKAISEQDMALLADVNRERLKNLQRDLIGKYEQEKKQTETARNQINTEWADVLDSYGPDNLPAQFKSNSDYDITDQKSLLFRLAKQYFESVDMKAKYGGPGGMNKAVSDAFLELIRLGSKKKKDTGNKKDERKHAKARSKSALGDGITKTQSTGKSTGKPKSDIEEYMKDRQANAMVHPKK